MVVLLAVGIGSLGAVAQQQQYDETDLVGMWMVEEQEGGDINLNVISISGFFLGNYSFVNEWGDEKIYGGGMLFDMYRRYDVDEEDVISNYEIVAFWISNGNKLHILWNTNLNRNPALQFVIESWENDRMVLHNYEGTCRMVVKKQGSGASAPAVVADAADNTEHTYNLNGVEVTNPESGLFITRKGNETRKVVRK